MQIPVSVRDCRTAVIAAIARSQAKLAEASETHRKSAFQALHDGAVHNGLDVNEARRKEMQDMVDRDVEHLMSHNPLSEFIRVLELQVQMLDYTHEDIVVIDEQDFSILKDHLPARDKVEAA